MTVKYLRDQRVTGTIAEIARLKFPFPDETHPDFETLTNNPRPQISVGKVNGEEIFPDIVVVRRPGQWLMIMADVETDDSLTDETALKRWLPAAQCGELLIYVPTGCVAQAKELIRRHHVAIKALRTWRFRPVWGLDVTEV